MTQYVLVLSSTRQALMPCHPARARELLNKNKAAVFRAQPFTIILHHRVSGDLQPIELKLDPGSKTTGLAVVVTGIRGLRCVMGFNLIHRGGAIKSALENRCNLRKSRRSRNTRYRQQRFSNRTRSKGWLPPSIQHRVDTTITWVCRLILASPVSSIVVEKVSFDTQQLRHPDIQGKEYQQGTLAGYRIRDYLLYRYNHTCQYCQGASKDPILQWEHVIARSRGGSDSIDNATLSCRTCNTHKGHKSLSVWRGLLMMAPTALGRAQVRGVDRVAQGLRPSLRDAAVVSVCNTKLIRSIESIGLLTTTGPGYQTKYNRSSQSYCKDHWIDAACVGETGSAVYISPKHQCLTVRTMGHGSRQMCLSDRYGFPRTSAKGPSRSFGFRTGDRVLAIIPNGKYFGSYIGRVAVRTTGKFDITAGLRKIPTSYKNCRLLQRSDGYSYTKI